MREVFLYRHPSFLEHDPGAGHPECPDRLRAIDAELRDRGLDTKTRSKLPAQAERRHLCRIHDPHYVDAILALRGREFALDGDTHVSPGSVDAALFAAGAAIEGVDAVLDKTCDAALCLVRPPGHHAEKDRAMGFCLFNNVAVGAEYAIAEKGVRRVLIFDPDVHHGNGTQHAFYARSDVFYVSIHQFPFFPGTGSLEETGTGEGQGYTANLPFPPGMGDGDYLHVAKTLLLPLIDEYRPDLVLFSAGFDTHALDPLAQMELSYTGYQSLYTTILQSLEKRKIPYLFILEGGYALPVLGKTVADLVESLLAGNFAPKTAPRPKNEAARTVRELCRRLEKPWAQPAE